MATADRTAADRALFAIARRCVVPGGGSAALVAAMIISGCGSDAPDQSVGTATATATASEPSVTSATTTNPPAATVKPLADAPTPSSTSTTPATASCRRLTDFDTDDGWVVVNDGVMGGRSAGAIAFADSAMRFTGEVVTAGGGFTSVRLPLAGDELTDSDSLDAPPFDPDSAREIGIIIGDGIDGPFELEIDWIDACTAP